MQQLMNSINYQFYKIVINKDDEFVGLLLAEDIVNGSSQLTGVHGDWNYLIVPRSKENFIRNLLLPH
jgi:hypothetical protein